MALTDAQKAELMRKGNELFNRGHTAVSLAGWSVQYASSAGTTRPSSKVNRPTMARAARSPQ